MCDVDTDEEIGDCIFGLCIAIRAPAGGVTAMMDGAMMTFVIVK